MDIFAGILIPTGNNIPKASEEYILAGIIDGVFLLAGIIAVIGIIMSAFRFITANGDPGQVTKAKQGLTYSIVGIIVVAIAFSAVRFVMTAISGT